MEKYGTARQATDDNKMQCMCFLCWISKATNAYPEYDKRIAFPRQKKWKWLRQRVAVLGYTYIAFLVINSETPSKYSHITMLPIRIQFNPVHSNTQQLLKTHKIWPSNLPIFTQISIPMIMSLHVLYISSSLIYRLKPSQSIGK